MPRIFCIGRNYGAHAKELGNNVPSSPIIFMKPWSSLVFEAESRPFPKQGKILNYELELVLEISQSPKDHSDQAVIDSIGGVTLGIDLTFRDLQAELKAAGLPWEKAKSFDGSALLGKIKKIKDLDKNKLNLFDLNFDLKINGVLKQSGNTKNMLFPISKLIQELNFFWKLSPGDLIYTGTPEGVGQLFPGDKLEASSDQLGEFFWEMGV